MKIHSLPSTFVLGYVRGTMIVHAFMIELDQLTIQYPRKVRNCGNHCTKSTKSSLVVSHSDRVTV